MKRTFAVLLCLCLFLTACGKEPAPTTPSTTPSTAAPTTEATAAPTTEPATESTTEPTTEPIDYYHPLTGELLNKPMTTRPVAIVTNNYRDAQPVLGISHADIVFEHVTEGPGAETRMLAIYTDLNFEGQLGSIRSARTYSVEIAAGFDAIFVHCGGSDYGMDRIAQLKLTTLDQYYNGEYFYRDSARKAAGYANEHILVTEWDLLHKGFAAKKLELTIPEDAYYGLDFSNESGLNGASAQTVDIQYRSTEGKHTIMTYNKDDGMYYGIQTWYKKQGTIGDGNTGDQIPFKNVIIIKSVISGTPNGVNVYQNLVGSGDGYLIRDGEYIPIQWHKPSAKDYFTFTTEDGSPVTLGVGKTFVSILPTISPEVIFE